MNSVGIDISKGRNTVAVMRPFGEVVISPFEVRHTGHELSELARQLKSLDGETRVVMEATGNYHAPVAKLLKHRRIILELMFSSHCWDCTTYEKSGDFSPSLRLSRACDLTVPFYLLSYPLLRFQKLHQRLHCHPPLPTDFYGREFLVCNHFPHLLAGGLEQMCNLFYGQNLAYDHGLLSLLFGTAF